VPRRALLQLGWTDGRNVATGSGTIGQLLEASRAVPIVFVTVADPAGAGNVDSYLITT